MANAVRKLYLREQHTETILSNKIEIQKRFPWAHTHTYTNLDRTTLISIWANMCQVWCEWVHSLCATDKSPVFIANIGSLWFARRMVTKCSDTIVKGARHWLLRSMDCKAFTCLFNYSFKFVVYFGWPTTTTTATIIILHILQIFLFRIYTEWSPRMKQLGQQNE